MLKRSVTLAALIGLMLVPSVPARGAAKREHQCSINTRAAFLNLDQGFPNAGTSGQLAGVFDASCDGGKVTTHLVSESRWTNTGVSTDGAVLGHFKTEETGYSDRGTLKTTTTGTSTPQPGNTFSVSGDSKFTGGTRLYRGATGSGTFTGSVAPNGVETAEGRATLTY